MKHGESDVLGLSSGQRALRLAGGVVFASGLGLFGVLGFVDWQRGESGSYAFMGIGLIGVALLLLVLIRPFVADNGHVIACLVLGVSFAGSGVLFLMESQLPDAVSAPASESGSTASTASVGLMMLAGAAVCAVSGIRSLRARRTSRRGPIDRS